MDSSTVFYVPPRKAKPPSDYSLFISSLSASELELLKFAETNLGSSFIVQFTHLYKNWKIKQKN